MLFATSSLTYGVQILSCEAHNAQLRVAMGWYLSQDGSRAWYR